jgi:hypothetical protein
VAAKRKGGGAGKGAARRAKVERRKRREGARKALRARREDRKREDELEEEAAELAELEPLSALFAADGPLAALRFDLRALPPAPRGSDAAGAIAEFYFEHLPSLAGEPWRARAKAALDSLRANLDPLEAHRGEASYDPDAAALGSALGWLDEPLASGTAAFYNTLFRFVFDRSCEASFLEGSLPAWVADAMTYTPAAVKDAIDERRHDRLSQRITLGVFHEDLAPDDMPSAAAMLTGPPLEAASFAAQAATAAEADMNAERRDAVATRLREAAAREREEGKPLLAFDLETLARALGSTDPIDQGLVRLFYARSIWRRRETATAPTSEWPV